MEQGCALCPRRCGARRDLGQTGLCGASGLGCARASLHRWEEPCLCGKSGSGAIFFTGCPLSCVFCQNDPISHQGQGRKISSRQLAEIFRRLEEAGACNINLVSPTPYALQIVEAFELYRPRLPVVYNTGGYERLETLALIDPDVDVYLPDLKYFSPDISQKYSGAADYFQQASQAVLYMLRQKGPAQFDSEGMMTRGVVIRHLVLPGNLRQTYLLIDWMKETIPIDTYISLMSQYFPAGRASDYPELNRRLTSGEYRRACRRLLDAGFENGFFQEKSAAAPDYVPEFDGSGLPSPEEQA